MTVKRKYFEIEKRMFERR